MELSGFFFTCVSNFYQRNQNYIIYNIDVRMFIVQSIDKFMDLSENTETCVSKRLFWLVKHAKGFAAMNTT